ncbi:MAG: outer membrane protein assembly factor BamE [Nitrospinota bacterium]
MIGIILLGASLLAACGPTDADFNKVEIGMTPKEVRAVMGGPDSTKEIFGAAEQWIYKDKYVVQFALGKVVIKEKR